MQAKQFAMIVPIMISSADVTEFMSLSPRAHNSICVKDREENKVQHVYSIHSINLMMHVGVFPDVISTFALKDRFVLQSVVCDVRLSQILKGEEEGTSKVVTYLFINLL